jgi:hypothetical protein
MTKWILSISILFAGQAFAQPSEVQFSCRAQIEEEALGIQVLKIDDVLWSQLEGSSDTSLILTEKQVLAASDAASMVGVPHIMNTIGITQADFAQAVIYTAGNFDDDAAGVRAVEFQDENGQVMKSGMFFGWAGPFECLSKIVQ